MNIATLIFSKPISELRTREFKICDNKSGHSFENGEIVNISQKDGRSFICVSKRNGTRSLVRPEDIQASVAELSEMTELAKEAEEKHKALQIYLDFMKETGATTLDEAAYKVWRIFKFIKELDENEAKTAIYELLNGE